MNTSSISSGPGRKQQMFQEICQEIHKIQLPEGVEFTENLATIDTETTYTVSIKGLDSQSKSYKITNLQELRDVYNENSALFEDQEGEKPNPELYCRLGGNTFSNIRTVIDNHRAAVFQRIQKNYIAPAKSNTLEDELTDYLLKIEVPYSSKESLGKIIRHDNDSNTNSRNVLKTRKLVRNVISHIDSSKLKKLLVEVEPNRLHNFLNRSWKPEKTFVFVNAVDIEKLISLLNSSRYNFSSCIDKGLDMINDPLKFAELLNSLDDEESFLSYYNTSQNYKGGEGKTSKLYSFIDRTNGQIGAYLLQSTGNSIDSYPVQRIADLANIGGPKNIIQLMQAIPQNNKGKLINIINKIQNLGNFAKIIGTPVVENITSFLDNFSEEEIINFIDTASIQEIDDFWLKFSFKEFDVGLEKPKCDFTWEQDYIDYHEAFGNTIRDFIQENFSRYFGAGKLQ